MYLLIPENQQFQPTFLLTKCNMWLIIVNMQLLQTTATICFEPPPPPPPSIFLVLRAATSASACIYRKLYRNSIKCSSDIWQTPQEIYILWSWMNNKKTKLIITVHMKKYLKHWSTSSAFFYFVYLKAIQIFDDLDHLLFWDSMA